MGGGNSISVILASNQYVGDRKLIETTYSLAHSVKPATIGYSIIRRIESWSESLQNAFFKKTGFQLEIIDPSATLISPPAAGLCLQANFFLSFKFLFCANFETIFYLFFERKYSVCEIFDFSS